MAESTATGVDRRTLKAEVPARGLRVVMLTTDERIDRRIIAEAQSLIEDGYDAYVLGAPIDGRGSFEHQGGVPIERVDVVRHGPYLEGIGMRAQRKPQLRKLATASLRAYRLARRTATRSVGALDGVLGRLHLGAPRVLTPLRLSAYEYAFFRRGLFYRPDVVHVHDLPLLKVGAMIRHATGARLVYDMHEFYPEQFVLSERDRLRLRRTEARHIRETDARFTVNPDLAQAIAHAYGIAVGVVQNAVVFPEQLHDRRNERLRDDLGIPPDQQILLYQGWLAANRNLETVIDAMALVARPVVFVLMGYGDYRDTLIERASAAGVQDRVFFVDAKEQDELLSYTASADVGLIPYLPGLDVNMRYVSPNKLYEFIAARLPMLANDLQFVRSVIEPNDFGIVANLDTPERAAAAIDAFPYEELPRFRKNLTRHGAAWAWQTEQQKLLEIYDAMLGNATRPRDGVSVAS